VSAIVVSASDPAVKLTRAVRNGDAVIVGFESLFYGVTMRLDVTDATELRDSLTAALGARS
jgi:hypothetical protein